MKNALRLILLIFNCFIVNHGFGQIINPIHWSFSSDKISNCEFDLIIKAKLDGGWHLYGQKSYGDDGPIPTSFHFTPNANYELIGTASEKTLIKKYDSVFGLELNYFEHKATFRQRVRIKSDQAIGIKGEFEFMVCNEVSCQPPTLVPFSFKLQGSADCKNVSGSSAGANMPCDCDLNRIARICFSNNGGPAIAEDKTETSTEETEGIGTSPLENIPAYTSENSSSYPISWWSIFIMSFLGGIAALLTPAVFPMIPITLFFFSRLNKTPEKSISNALTFSTAIIFTFVVLGFSLVSFFNRLSSQSTNVFFNLLLFAALILIAISFLGAFKFSLMAGLAPKSDSRFNLKELIAILFLTCVLCVLSLSCAGPIIGTILIQAAINGGAHDMLWALSGFTVALAIAFGTLAFISRRLNLFLNPGSWRHTVKIVLGFLALVFALKFASNVDLITQSGILTREVFISIWIMLFGILGIYLLGGIKLSHDKEMTYLSVPRLFAAILVFSFTFYLIPGLWGAPLKLISGFIPPLEYSESPGGLRISENRQAVSNDTTVTVHKKEHCPNELPCFHDYDEALAYARKVNKPLMIDFTGWACVSCRSMESKVWADAEVDARLRNEVVLVSLYVDDKTDLPADQQTIKKLGDRDFAITSIGNKWCYLQANRYKTNSQPQYILIDNKEQMLTQNTKGYDPDVQNYIDWLDEGINEYKKRAK
ncbi:MAG TPA: thioredoxin family protein [Bacteroidia bacterium]|jgi:thiol:disulfide interchange protein DsbD